MQSRAQYLDHLTGKFVLRLTLAFSLIQVPTAYAQNLERGDPPGSTTSTTTTTTLGDGKEIPCSIAFTANTEALDSGQLGVSFDPEILELLRCFDFEFLLSNEVTMAGQHTADINCDPEFSSDCANGSGVTGSTTFVAGCCFLASQVPGAADVGVAIANPMTSNGMSAIGDAVVFDITCGEAAAECLDGGSSSTTTSTSTTTTSTTTTTTLDSVPVTTTITVGSTTTTSTTTTTLVLPTTTSTSTTSTTTTTLPGQTCGDPNGDGLVTAVDALIALSASVGKLLCPLFLCDTTGDGDVQASDALLILRRAVDVPVDLSCPAQM